MLNVFYVVLFIIVCSRDVIAVQRAALPSGEGEYQLSADQLSKIPFLHHHDAKKFYEKMKPVFVEYNRRGTEEKRNPYVVYFETMIFGKTFGLMAKDKIDENLKVALSKLISNVEDFEYWAKVCDFELDSPVYRYLSKYTLKLAQKKKGKNKSNNQNYTIPLVFVDAVEKLEENIFGCYWLGLVQHEAETKNKAIHLQTQQKVGSPKTTSISSIDYLTYAADGFCELALDILLTINLADNTEKITGKKEILRSISHIINNPDHKSEFSILNVFLTYLIQNDIFSKQHMLSFDQENGLPPINNIRKLTSSLVFNDSSFQKPYQDCYDTLYSKMSAERNKSFFSTENLMWKCTTLGYPCFVMGLNAYLFYYYLDDDHSKSAKNNLVLLAQKGLFTMSASLVTFGIGAYTMYNRAIFSSLGDDVMEDEISLMALYLASKPSEQESYKIRAEKFYNQLYRTPAGFRPNLLPKMSQIALNYEE